VWVGPLKVKCWYELDMQLFEWVKYSDWNDDLLCIKMLYYTFWKKQRTNSTGEEFMEKKKFVNFK